MPIFSEYEHFTPRRPNLDCENLRFFASAATASFSRNASSTLCIAVRFRRANWLRMIHVLDAERPLAPVGGIWYHIPVFGQQEVRTLPKSKSRNPKPRFARPKWVYAPRIVLTPFGAGFVMHRSENL